MLDKAIGNRLLRAGKRGAPTSLLLWALTALGFVFWVPPVVRAMSGDSTTRHNRSRAARQETTPAHRAAHVTRRETAGAERPVQETFPACERGGLSLQATIVGEKRRAALVNGSLYSAGSEIPIGGELYVLSRVGPRQVELKKGEQVIVLEIPGLPASAGWGWSE